MSESLQASLAAVEAGLDALAAALRGDDSDAVTRCSSQLHAALIDALRSRDFMPSEPLPAALRERLLAARGQIAGQRESIARAQAAAGRAAEVLMPGAALYDLHGAPRRPATSGAARA